MYIHITYYVYIYIYTHTYDVVYIYIYIYIYIYKSLVASKLGHGQARADISHGFQMDKIPLTSMITLKSLFKHDNHMALGSKSKATKRHANEKMQAFSYLRFQSLNSEI